MAKSATLSIRDRIAIGYLKLYDLLQTLTEEQLSTTLIVRSKSTGISKLITVKELLAYIYIYLKMFETLNKQNVQLATLLETQLSAVNGLQNVLSGFEANKQLHKVQNVKKESGDEPFRYRQVTSSSGYLDQYDTSGIEQVPHVPIQSTIYDMFNGPDMCADFGLFDVCVGDITGLNAVSWVLDKIINNLIKYVIQPIWTGLLYAYKTLRYAFEKIYETLTKIVDAIVNFFSSIPDWFMEGWNSFIEFFTNVGEMFKEGFDMVIGFLTDVGNSIVDGVNTVIRPFKVIIGFFKTIYNEVYNFATDTAPKFFNRVISTVKDFIFDVILKTAEQTTTNLQLAVAFIIKNLEEGMAVILDQIDNLKDIFIGGFGNVKLGLEDMIDTIAEGTDKLKDAIITNIGGSMIKNFANLTDSIDYITNSASYGLDGFKNILLAQPAKIGQTLDVVQDIISTTVDQGKTIFTDFGDRLQKIGTSTLDETKQLLQSRSMQSFNIVKDGFDNLSDVVTNQLITGLTNSVDRAKREGSETIDQVQKSFSDLASNVQTELSDVFSRGVEKVKTTFSTRVPLIIEDVSATVGSNIDRSLNSLNESIVTRTQDSVNNTVNILQSGVKDFTNVLQNDVASSFSKGFDKLQAGSKETVNVLQNSFQDIAKEVERELSGVFNQGLDKVTTTFTTKVPTILQSTVDDSVAKIQDSIDIFTNNLLTRSQATAKFLQDSSEAGIQMVKDKTLESVKQAYDAFWAVWQPVVDFFSSYGKAIWNIITELSAVPDKLQTYKWYFIAFATYIVFVKAMDWYVGHLGFQFDMFGKPYGSL